jgi:hypothetical protein
METIRRAGVAQFPSGGPVEVWIRAALCRRFDDDMIIPVRRRAASLPQRRV